MYKYGWGVALISLGVIKLGYSGESVVLIFAGALIVAGLGQLLDK